MKKTYAPFTDPSLTLFINHTPISPAAKTIKAHACSTTNPTAFPRKLKIEPTTLPIMTGNVSKAFPASLLRTFVSLSNHFVKITSSFGGESLPSLPPPNASLMARRIVEIVIERAVNIESIVILCSRKRVRILSANNVFWSRTFSMVCLTLATCVWRSFRYCDSISSLACFSVFKLSNLSLYNCLWCRYRWDHFLLPPGSWYPFWCDYQSLLILKYYLRVHLVCFVRPYQYQGILAYWSQYFVMLLVF